MGRLVRAELVKSVALMTEGEKDVSEKTEVVDAPPRERLEDLQFGAGGPGLRV